MADEESQATVADEAQSQQTGELIDQPQHRLVNSGKQAQPSLAPGPDLAIEKLIEFSTALSVCHPAIRWIAFRKIEGLRMTGGLEEMARGLIKSLFNDCSIVNAGE